MTINIVKTTNITSYFSSTGEIRLRTYTTRADNVCCYADFLNFAIEYNNSGPTTKDYQATSVAITRGTLGGNVANLATNNSSYLTVTAAKSGSLYYNDWYARTVIGEARANVAKLTITYDGKYSSSQSQGLYLYNFVTSVWARLDYRSVSTTDTTITFVTTAIPSYISSAGEIRLRIYTQSYSSHICSADYVKFSLEMTSGGSPALQNITTTAATLNGGEVKLYDNLFNPAKGERTRVDYTIDDEGQVTIKIYNIVGELVRTLVDDNKTAGSYTEYWNGRNDSSETVASGVYLFYIETPGIKTIKKAAVIK
jgi:hypothetical protein